MHDTNAATLMCGDKETQTTNGVYIQWYKHRNIRRLLANDIYKYSVRKNNH